MLDEALAKAPDDVRLRRAKVQVLLGLNRSDEAKALLEDSMRLAPDDEGLIRLRAIAAGGTTLDRVERVIADLPADAKLRTTRRLLLLSQLRDSNRAALAQVAPDGRAAAEAELARIEAALADARAALAKMSPDDPIIFELAFNDAVAAGDMASAQTAAANAATSCSDRSLGAVLRARLAMERNAWAAAAAEFERAVERVAPHHLPGHQCLQPHRDRGGDAAAHDAERRDPQGRHAPHQRHRRRHLDRKAAHLHQHHGLGARHGRVEPPKHREQQGGRQ